MVAQTFKTDLAAVQYMIHQSGSSSWNLEKTTGISRQTIDRWIKAKTLNIRRAAIMTFAKHLKYRIHHNQDGVVVSLQTKKRKKTEMRLLGEAIHAPVETTTLLLTIQRQRHT